MAAGSGRRTTAGLGLAAVLLCGCSDESKPAETLPSASDSPSTSAEALPPLGPPDFPVPAEAREKTPEGALEFIRYYMRLTEESAERRLDPQTLVDLSQGCGICIQISESIAGDQAAGYRYEATSTDFRPNGPGILSGDQAEVAFVYSQGPVTVLDAAGQVVAARSAPATGELQSGAQLVWDAQRSTWLVTSLTVG
ncbi:hypothetical protein [Blastococcus sp. TF02A-26]|uniref:hypothetical protein n=1 Tax=Blastococcus sp. TF02A-26 TaxID=2250577 RepID=UPI000DE96568|nr:hypothetical protein [Blastococcus sp. TF02A-26]RBY87368.1 hypothetical protein DQ240_07190 [Blastococcus sp. TF02A-26]